MTEFHALIKPIASSIPFTDRLTAQKLRKMLHFCWTHFRGITGNPACLPEPHPRFFQVLPEGSIYEPHRREVLHPREAHPLQLF